MLPPTKEEFIEEAMNIKISGLTPTRLCVEGLARYIYDKEPTGGFLQAVISNDLRRACQKADEHNLSNLPVYIAILYNLAPSGCWGSPNRMNEWLMNRS